MFGESSRVSESPSARDVSLSTPKRFLMLRVFRNPPCGAKGRSRIKARKPTTAREGQKHRGLSANPTVAIQASESRRLALSALGAQARSGAPTPNRSPPALPVSCATDLLHIGTFSALRPPSPLTGGGGAGTLVLSLHCPLLLTLESPT